MTNRDQRRPNCPVCGTYTAARNRRRRQNCEPFCTMRCAAEYGRFAFADGRENVWDVQSRCWVATVGLTKNDSYLYFEEATFMTPDPFFPGSSGEVRGWWRREPKRWHSEEDY